MHFISSYVLDVIHFAEQHGVDRSLLEDTLGPQPSNFGRPDVFVNYDVLERVLDRAVALTKDGFFGLHMGEQISLAATKYVDQMIDSSSDVKTAFENAVAYSRMISDSMDCSLHLEEDRFRVNFELNPNWKVHSSNSVMQNLDVALVCAVKSLQRLTASNYMPVAVNLYYPRPRNWNEHYRIFDCSLNFNQKVSSICFDKHLLGAQVQSKDIGLLQRLSAHANAVLKRLPVEGSTTYKVKKALLGVAPLRTFKIEEVATEMSVGERTLQRRLQEEGNTFKEVLAEVRMKLAKKMLIEKGSTISDVAYLLGFSEPSAFVRAFKTWTQSTPKQFQIRHVNLE